MEVILIRVQRVKWYFRKCTVDLTDDVIINLDNGIPEASYIDVVQMKLGHGYHLLHVGCNYSFHYFNMKL